MTKLTVVMVLLGLSIVGNIFTYATISRLHTSLHYEETKVEALSTEIQELNAAWEDELDRFTLDWFEVWQMAKVAQEFSVYDPLLRLIKELDIPVRP